MAIQHPIISFKLNCPDPTGSLPFTTTDKAAYTSQYTTWFSTVDGGNNLFKSNGSSILLYGEQAMNLKKLIDSGKLGGTYQVLDKVIEGNLSSYLMGPDAVCWGLATGTNDTIWVSDRISSGLWKFNTKTEVMTFYEVSDVSLFHVCLGSDGNMWATDSGLGDGIVRVTPSGTVSKFAINEDENTSLTPIITGGDGNIWTSDDEGNVFKVGTDGTVLATYYLEDPDTELALYSYDMCLGPDNNVWIVDGRGPIWKVESDGTATKYANGVSFSYISAGPDGFIWLTTGSSKALWRLSTDGDFKEFPTSIILSKLSSGPDQNLWGVSWQYYAKFSPHDGSIETFNVPDLTGRDVCLGSDNHLWLGCNKYIRKIS